MTSTVRAMVSLSLLFEKRCGISDGCCPRIPRFHFVALYFDRRPTLKRKCGPSIVVLFLLSEDLAHALPKMGLLLQESPSLKTCRNLQAGRKVQFYFPKFSQPGKSLLEILCTLGRWDTIGRLEIEDRRVKYVMDSCSIAGRSIPW